MFWYGKYISNEHKNSLSIIEKNSQSKIATYMWISNHANIVWYNEADKFVNNKAVNRKCMGKKVLENRTT